MPESVLRTSTVGISVLFFNLVLGQLKKKNKTLQNKKKMRMNTGSHFRRKFKRMFSDGPNSLLSLVFLLNKHTRATKSVVWSQCSNIDTF